LSTMKMKVYNMVQLERESKLLELKHVMDIQNSMSVERNRKLVDFQVMASNLILYSSSLLH
jgi:hypothetical protein